MPASCSAKDGRDKLCKIIREKGLEHVLSDLPAASSIVVEPQIRFASAYPQKVRIGFRNGMPVWAALGPLNYRQKTADQAPDILFYTGRTEAGLSLSSTFSGQGETDMVEPFKAFWEKTGNMINVDLEKSQSGLDQRRGQFKSLVYWYFVNEAAARDDKCHIPKTVPGYFVSALKNLGKAERTAVQLSTRNARRGDADGVSTTRDRLSGHEKDQQEVRGEAVKLKNEQMEHAVEAKNGEEEKRELGEARKRRKKMAALEELQQQQDEKDSEALPGSPAPSCIGGSLNEHSSTADSRCSFNSLTPLLNKSADSTAPIQLQPPRSADVVAPLTTVSEDICVTGLKNAFDQHVELSAKAISLQHRAAELKRKYEDILEQQAIVDNALRNNKKTMAQIAGRLSRAGE